MRRLAAIGLPMIAAIVALAATTTPAHADEDVAWIRPAIQIGGHAETGGGVLPGSGFKAHEQGGGVALALSLMGPARPRVLVGVAFELTGARAKLEDPTVDGTQSYGVASVRGMARAELWSRSTLDHTSHGTGYYALLGAGWNYNGVGTEITFVAGAPAGTAEDLHLDSGPTFEAGGGMEMVRKTDGTLFAELTWVYNAPSYRLVVSGEPDRTGRSDLSGVTVLIGLRFNLQTSEP